MKKNKWFIVATVAAAGAYGIIRGKGVFNKPRFKEQHDAVSRYISSHYPNAAYSPIEATENGWATIIKRIGEPQIFLYVTKTKEGVYVFNETTV